MRWAVVLAIGACTFDPSHAAPGAAVHDAPRPLDGIDAIDAVDAPPDAAPPFALEGMRWSIACIGPIPGNANGCTCDMTSPSYTQTVMVGGGSDEQWQVNVHIVGATEGFGFVGGSADGSDGWYIGGSTGLDTGDNSYEIIVSSPAQHYYINNGSTTNTFSVVQDYATSFPVAGGATVTFTADPGDNLEWQGIDASGSAIAIPGFTAPPPVDNLYGQWAYVIVDSAVPL